MMDEPPRARRRVLVIEDHPGNLELIAALLEREGCGVLMAKSAEVGISMAEEQPPDLILMDVDLPRMTGYEATRRLKANPVTARVPIVAFTAYAMRGEEEKAREAGCDGYLSKPIEIRAFREALRRFLGRDRSPDSSSEGGGKS